MTENGSEQKIMPYFWFDDKAEEAAQHYVSLFSSATGGGETGIGSVSRYDKVVAEATGRPEGMAMTVEFQLAGHKFVALNGGPDFNITPAISFFVSCDTEAEIDELWAGLSEGGQILMPLDDYGMSEKYGWTNDRFGVSWQLNLASAPQKITPVLMFVGEQHGNCEQAIQLYTSLFEDAHLAYLLPHEAEGGETEGNVRHALFTLAGQTFMAMDSGRPHDFSFTEGVSLLVTCEGQDEVDYFWEALTEGGQEQPCAWLKDRYGVSWQIVPKTLMRLLNDPDPEKAQRVVQAMLQMKKIDIAGLERAYNQA